MFRKSSFLAVALGLTAMGAATFPAAAMPSQHLGGVKMPMPVQAQQSSAGLHPITSKLPLPVSQVGIQKMHPPPLPMQVSQIGSQKVLPAQLPVPVGPAGSQKVLPAQFPMPVGPAGSQKVLPAQFPIP